MRTKIPNVSNLVKKVDYDTINSEIENKISDTSGLVKMTDYNAKINEIEGKIPNIIGLATNAALKENFTLIHEI